MTLIIKRVEPIVGLVPALRFTAALRLDLGEATSRLFVAKWIGDVGLTRQPEGPGLVPAGPTKLVQPATWLSEPEGSRRFSSTDGMATFTCEMTPSIIEAIERFREGGRLFVRLQGKFQTFSVGVTGVTEQAAIGLFLRPLLDFRYGLWLDLASDSYELTRDLWCAEILPALRPPGRVILEAQLPLAVADEEHGRRALGHLDVAQRAFDEGRYEEAARLVYKAGEALQQLGSVVQARYGDLAQSSIAKQNSALQALCHPERHDESKVVGGHDTDRPMALHLITSMKSLAAVYLAGPPRSAT